MDFLNKKCILAWKIKRREKKGKGTLSELDEVLGEVLEGEERQEEREEVLGDKPKKKKEFSTSSPFFFKEFIPFHSLLESNHKMARPILTQFSFKNGGEGIKKG